jgi:pimeloyl-ACP methyl ester carboxylesterase
MVDQFLNNVETITLKRGELRFTAFAAGAGPTVLCAHGFPDNARSFRHQFADLVAAGYRVVAPTARGYEESSQPRNGDYRVGEMARDIIAWVDDLGEDKVHLVGHDWGAIMAYGACAEAPERFHSLTTIAIPHPGRFTNIGIQKVPTQLLKSWYMMFFQLPGVPEWMLDQFDWALIRWLRKAWSPGFDVPQAEWSALRNTFETPGVAQAMLAYYRNNVSAPVLLGLKSTAVTGLREVQVRTLAITGELDGCMDTRLHDCAMLEKDFPAGIRVVRIKGGGHFVHQELPGEVNRYILEWISAS